MRKKSLSGADAMFGAKGLARTIEAAPNGEGRGCDRESPRGFAT